MKQLCKSFAINSQQTFLLVVSVILFAVLPARASVGWYEVNGERRLDLSADNFPDAAFLHYLKFSMYQQNSEFNDTSPWDSSAGKTYLTSSDVEKVKIINLQGRTYENQLVADLTGINYFTSLTTLNVRGHNLTALDLSGLSGLAIVYAERNRLTSFTLNGCTALSDIRFAQNFLPRAAISSLIQSLNDRSDIDQGVIRPYFVNTTNADLGQWTNDENEVSVSSYNLAISKNWDIKAYTKVDNTYTSSSNIRSFDGYVPDSYNNSSVFPLSDDDANSNTYKGWVDNTDGHLIAANIRGTIWTGIDLPQERFIYVNSANFPDAEFRNYIKTQTSGNNEGYRLGYDGVLTENEVSKITHIGYINTDLVSFIGLKYLTALSSFRTSGTKITEIDLSRNVELTNLIIPSTSVKQLDLTYNTKLTRLECFLSRQLKELNLTNNVLLTYLNCNQCALQELDLSNNTGLTTLNCSNNNLKELNLSNNTALLELLCSSNQLTELDLSNNTALTKLSCSDNHLTALDLSKITFAIPEQGEEPYLDYFNQTRDIVAESAVLTVVENDQEVQKKIYYLRLDEKVSGAGEKPIWERMTEGNYGNVESSFLLDNVLSWTNGVIIEGRRNVASVDEVNPDKVYGNILLLTDVSEQNGVASGTVTYTYDVQNDYDDPDGSLGDFTLNWTASAKSDVVTEVTDLGVTQREPVAVSYYNVAGMSSDWPWQGVNIVVTRYSDGTTETSKMVR